MNTLQEKYDKLHAAALNMLHAKNLDELREMKKILDAVSVLSPDNKDVKVVIALMDVLLEN